MLMFIHPLCPCTRASLRELAVLQADITNRVQTYVVVLSPENAGSDWTNSFLCRSALEIPGVQLLYDHQGIESARFGSMTSGHVAYYDAHGHLRFNGGITASRGHSGDNDGRSSLRDWIQRGAASRDYTPVFGCPLQETSLETSLVQQTKY